MTITNGYATEDQFREHFKDSGQKLDEGLIHRAINAASRAIDDHCGRRFWRDPEAALTTYTYRPDDPYTAWVNDISTTTGLIIKTDTAGDGTWATTWAATDYQLEPLNPVGAHAFWRIVAIDRYTFPCSSRRVSLQVTARHGWSAVPDPVVDACLLKAAALYKRAEAPFGVLGSADWGAIRIGRSDPDVVSLLAPYVRLDMLVA